MEQVFIFSLATISMSLLGREELMALIKGNPPLVDGMIKPQLQIQPNGIDLTIHSIRSLESAGSIGLENTDRKLPIYRAIGFDSEGWLKLRKGSYNALFNEILNIPNYLAAIARPRTSLLRSGVTVETAIWDAGYSGRSECLLVVHNEHGFRIKENSRVLQVVFLELSQAPKKTYSGVYQRENISTPNLSKGNP